MRAPHVVRGPPPEVARAVDKFGVARRQELPATMFRSIIGQPAAESRQKRAEISLPSAVGGTIY